MKNQFLKTSNRKLEFQGSAIGDKTCTVVDQRGSLKMESQL